MVATEPEKPRRIFIFGKFLQSRRWLVTMGPWWVLFIFFGPGGAGVEKNCKVKPVSFYFWSDFGVTKGNF